MAFIIIILIIGIVALISGGSLHNLKNVVFRYSWLVLVAVALKIITNSSLRYNFHIPDFLATKLYIGSFVLIGLFIILNIHLRGFFLIGLGLIANATAIIANSGYMPVKKEYLMITSSAQDLELINQGLPAFNYVATGPSTKFYYLCDIFMMPHWVLVTKVFSIGDVLLTIGGAIFVWTFLRSSGQTKVINNFLIK